MATVHAIGANVYCYERATIDSQFSSGLEGISPNKKVWFLWQMHQWQPKEYLGYFMTRKLLLEHIYG